MKIRLGNSNRTNKENTIHNWVEKYSDILHLYPFAIFEIDGDQVIFISATTASVLGIEEERLKVVLNKALEKPLKTKTSSLPERITFSLPKSKTQLEARKILSFTKTNAIYQIAEKNKKGKIQTEKEALENIIKTRTHELELTEARLRLLLQSVPLAFYSYPANQHEDIWYSEHIEHLSGFPLEKFVKDPLLWRDRINPEDYSKLGGSFDRLSEINQRVACEYRWKRADNQEIWIYDQAILIEAIENHPQQIIGCFMNITDFKQAEFSILESERNYREIFNLSNDAIFIHNAKTGIIEDVNNTMLCMFDLSYDEALECDLDDLSLAKPPYDKETAAKMLNLATKNGSHEFEWRSRRSDGTVFWTNVVLKSIVHNNQSKIMAIVRNIDQQKKDEERIKYQNAFEKLILAISTQFISLPYYELDKSLVDAIKKICAFSETSAGYLFLYRESKITLDLTYHWQNNKITLNIKDLTNVPQETVKWHTQKIKAQQDVIINDTNTLPDEAGILRELLIRQNVLSFVDVPLLYQTQVIGFLGLATEKPGRNWLEEEVSLLKIIGQSFVNAIKRKESVLAVLESEQSHREIYNATNEAIIVHDLYSGRFIDVNNALLVMYGYTYEEALNLSFADISSGNAPFNQEHAIELIRKTEKEGSQVIEWHARRKDQSLFWVEISMKMAEIRGVKRILSVIRDITDRKQTEEQLRINEEKYRLMIEGQTDLVVKVDTEGRFLFVSHSYCELFGKTEEELLGNKFMPLVHEEDLKTTIKAMEKLYEAPYTCYVEQRALTSRGWRWIAWSDKAILDENNNVIEIVGVGRDMTYQKGVEEALRRSEDRFRSIVQQLSDIVFICDKETNIVYDTPSISNILNYNEGYLVGQPFDKLVIEADHAIVRNIFSQIQKKNTLPQKAELRVRKNSGEYLPMEGIFINFLEHQTIKGVVITLRDISERKMLDKKVLDAVIKTEEQERERFAKNLHDDLGPLLSSIKMYVNSFSTANDKSKREYITSQLNEVVKEAITTTKEVSNDLSPHILINYGLVAAIENFLNKIPSNIKVDFKSSLTSQRYSNSIENSFYRIVKELINNTLKHANATKIKITLAEENQELHLDYSDNGQGVEWKDMKPEGTKGMGISNIISRAKSLNGKYNFESQKGFGFNFKISIPIHQALD